MNFFRKCLIVVLLGVIGLDLAAIFQGHGNPMVWFGLGLCSLSLYLNVTGLDENQK